MLLTSLKRTAKAGFFNFWRNGYVSLASILVMVVTLFVIGSVIFTGTILDHTLSELKSKVDINVYFTTEAPEDEVLSLKESLENLPEVEEVSYQSREDVLAEFKQRHEDDQVTLAALEELEDNPLGAQLNINAQNPSQYSTIASFLNDQNPTVNGDEPIIDKVNYNQNREAINKLSGIISTADRLGLTLAVLLIVISVLITFNTIRLAIYISRDEISVMRLVGASTSYIRGPFVVTGILYGLVASIVTLGLLLPATYWLGNVTESFFIGLNVFEYYLSNFWIIAAQIVGAGILIGALSSYIAVRKYLRF